MVQRHFIHICDRCVIKSIVYKLYSPVCTAMQNTGMVHYSWYVSVTDICCTCRIQVCKARGVFPRVILIGCNKLLLSNAFLLTAAALCCSVSETFLYTAHSALSALNWSRRPHAWCCKCAIAAFPGRQKQKCVASLKSQIQAPQA